MNDRNNIKKETKQIIYSSIFLHIILKLMIRIGVFASGSGTNAENIIAHFKDTGIAHVHTVFTNNAHAGVIARAHQYRVHCEIFSNADLKVPGKILALLQLHKIDFVVLAGFLRLMPVDIIRAYENRIINIHPALLPNYGGQGMYGRKVHEAVIAASEKESGISIHYVNEKFDEGKIIFQAKTAITKEDTAETLADKIHQLEYDHFPEVIEKLVDQISQKG